MKIFNSLKRWYNLFRIDYILDKLPPVIEVHIDQWDGKVVEYQLTIFHCGETSVSYRSNDNDVFIHFGSWYSKEMLFYTRATRLVDAVCEMRRIIKEYGLSTSRYEFIYDTKSEKIRFYKGYDREAFLKELEN